MEKETIIKALECFHNRILNSKLAEKVTEQEMMAIIDALALIKELTEKVEAYRQELGKVRVALNNANVDNKRLTEECEKLTINMNAYGLTAKRLAEENERLRKHNVVLIEDNHILSSECIPMTKANTVREFAERLKYTLCINNEENTEFFDYSYTLETIDEVANKILNNTEEENGTK